MFTEQPALYFAISDRDGEKTTMHGNAIFSIQKLKKSESLEIIQHIKNPKTGQYMEQRSPLPALNYETSVKYADPFLREALITITRITKNGRETKEFRLNKENPNATFIDENYVIKFGIDTFEQINDNTPSEEVRGIVTRCAEKVKNLVGLSKISILSTGSSTREDSLSK